jgi:hypothetical protein
MKAKHWCLTRARILSKWVKFPKESASILLLLIGVVVIFPVGARADLARDYSAVPVYSWYPAYYFSYSESRAEDGTKITSAANLFRITETVDIFGRCGGWNVIIPYECVKLSGDHHAAYQQDGMGDPKLVLDVNIFGAPAYSKAEFSNYTAQTYCSFHLGVTAPLGKYGRENPVNVGSDRWTITPEVNFSYTPNQGETWLEFYVKPTFYTDNNAYDNDKTMSEKPSLDLELHASQNIGKRWWAALDLYYNVGGETSVNGAWQENRDSTLSAGCTVNFTPWHHGRILLSYKESLSTPSGAAESRSVMLYVAQLF